MNLFLSTRRLAKGREEDHLTEFFGAALELDEHFRTAYASFVIAPFAERQGWAEPRIISVETQKPCEGHSSCPDMTLSLADGHTIICEHKLEAVESFAPVGSEVEEKVPQLRRYLDGLPIDGLVFVRASLKPPEEYVLAHPKYIRPTHRLHFLWRDFWPLLDGSAHPYCRWLCQGFGWLGFTPPHPFVGDLSDPESRRNFAKLWSATTHRAHELGWHVGAGAVVELYLEKRGAKPVSQVWVCPRDELLLVRATPASEAEVPEVLRRFQSVARGLAPGVTVDPHHVQRTAGKTAVIDAWAPLQIVLGESGTGEQIEARLCEFVVPFLREVS
jgi:hypothetical protein